MLLETETEKICSCNLYFKSCLTASSSSGSGSFKGRRPRIFSIWGRGGEGRGQERRNHQGTTGMKKQNKSGGIGNARATATPSVRATTTYLYSKSEARDHHCRTGPAGPKRVCIHVTATATATSTLPCDRPRPDHGFVLARCMLHVAGCTLNVAFAHATSPHQYTAAVPYRTATPTKGKGKSEGLQPRIGAQKSAANTTVQHYIPPPRRHKPARWDRIG